MAEMMLGRERDASAADWIRSRRERIVAAVQARKHGDAGRPEDAAAAAAAAADDGRAGEDAEDPAPVAQEAHDGAAGPRAPSRSGGRGPRAGGGELPNVVVVRSGRSGAGAAEDGGRRKKIIVDFDNMFGDAPAAAGRRPSASAAAARAAGGGKSKCVRKIEDIEKRRRERRSSAKHAMQMKENIDVPNYALLRLVEKSKASCGVLDYDAADPAAADPAAAGAGARGGSPGADKENALGPRGAALRGAEASEVSVFVRKRPMNGREYAADAVDCVSVGAACAPPACAGGRSAVVMHEPKVRVDLRREVEQHRFEFDGAFSAGQASARVYAACVSPVVHAAMAAYAAGARAGRRGPARSGGTVFAYGQTGSGKTYTMQRMLKGAVEETFAILGAGAGAGGEAAAAAVEVSCYEIYAGKVFDLLGAACAAGGNAGGAAHAHANRSRSLQVREDARGNVVVVGLSRHACRDAASVMALARRAEAMRATGSTAANDLSSRSHYVFQMDVAAAAGRGGACKLRLVDLAGSERGADTNCSDRRTRQEGAEINKSLLALKECIRALHGEGAAGGGGCHAPAAAGAGADGGDNHVPFRGCRLTHLLRDAFVGGGDGAAVTNKLAVLACIAPGSDSVEHSLNTLRYAAHIKEFARGADAAAAAPQGPNRVVKLNQDDVLRVAVLPEEVEQEEQEAAAAAPDPAPAAGVEAGSPSSAPSSPEPDEGQEDGLGGGPDDGADDAMQRRRLGELCGLQQREVDALQSALRDAEELMRRMGDWRRGDAAGHARVIEALKLRMLQQREELLRLERESREQAMRV